RSDSLLWSWGGDFFNELGDGISESKFGPVRMGSAIGSTAPHISTADTTWQSISSGGDHNLAISINGGLLSWGWLISNEDPVIISEEGWDKVSVEVNHVLGIQNDGSLWAWGSNSRGQL